MTIPSRRLRAQLSMYVPRDDAFELEAIRLLVDPVQSRLIPAHVTLCRESELAEISEIELARRLAASHLKPITLRFGPAEVFDGHGILLRCIEGEGEFQALREHVLGSRKIMAQAPHITLAHPRNPKSPGNSLSNTAQLPEVHSFSFSMVCLIKQQEDEPWTVIQEFQLECS